MFWYQHFGSITGGSEATQASKEQAATKLVCYKILETLDHPTPRSSASSTQRLCIEIASKN